MTDNNSPARWAQGYADATGWLPAATPDELIELFERKFGKGTVFVYPDHSLAAYWGVPDAPRALRPGDDPIGDVDPWDDYGQGFYSALHNNEGVSR